MSDQEQCCFYRCEQPRSEGMYCDDHQRDEYAAFYGPAPAQEIARLPFMLPQEVMINDFAILLERWLPAHHIAYGGFYRTAKETICLNLEYGRPSNSCTVLHELIHAISHVHDLELTENQVGVLGKALVDLFNNNPWLVDTIDPKRRDEPGRALKNPPAEMVWRKIGGRHQRTIKEYPPRTPTVQIEKEAGE